jgi:glyoxylase-like metal-dependent hydrolase (beta-lactamase superfamily II)
VSIEITTIRLPLPLKMSTVNCYLIHADGSFFLIDTGMTNNRRQLEAELERLGCQPGNLELILLTHGDFDHTSNAVYLRQRYGAKIAMHKSDVGMLENGDMFWERKIDNRLLKGLFQLLIPFKAENRGRPDIYLDDGDSLMEYGLDAEILITPGHSSGSICILTTAGDLICGDLLTNSTGKPMLNSMMYDRSAGDMSFARLKSFPIQTVYPGHGNPFSWNSVL